MVGEHLQKLAKSAAAVAVSGIAESQALRRVADGEFVPVARAIADVLTGSSSRAGAAGPAAPSAASVASQPRAAPPPPPPPRQQPAERQQQAAGAAASAAASASARRAEQEAHAPPARPAQHDPPRPQAFSAAPAAASGPAASPFTPADRPSRHEPTQQTAASAQRQPGAAADDSARRGSQQSASAASTSAARPSADSPSWMNSLPNTTGRQKARTVCGRSVPSTQLGRIWGFAGLGASLALGTVKDAVSRAWTGPAQGESGEGGAAYSAFLTEKNAERLAVSLCRMRGAALKLGQMLSIQDESVIPPQIQKALERVRQGADVMPTNQLYQVLAKELGPEWRAQLSDFGEEPIAAASIGQVHKATLLDGRHVAMKIQYPGVAESIDSDIDNLMRLVRMTDMLPKGLYVDQAVRVAKQELALECDYRWELEAQRRFSAMLQGDPSFRVPGVVEALCSERVLTTELAPGVAIDKVADMSQEERDLVGTSLLRLILRELFEFRFMQTDPNFANFLYDQPSGKLTLIDFGAAKQYPDSFVDDYLHMVAACARKDRQTVLDASRRLGFLTGDESKVMLDAHCEAAFVVGMPFAQKGTYDFSRNQMMTRRVGELGQVMLKHRLKAPPEYSYSLHRKLSGAFLTCMRIGARVPCHDLFFSEYERRFEGRTSGPIVKSGPAPGFGGEEAGETM